MATQGSLLVFVLPSFRLPQAAREYQAQGQHNSQNTFHYDTMKEYRMSDKMSSLSDEKPLCAFLVKSELETHREIWYSVSV